MKSITKTNWFSQPGFLGVESSWTMSPARTEGTLVRSRIREESVIINQRNFSGAIEDLMNLLPSHHVWN